MLKIKRLYTFMLQTFLPQLMMTFFICLFIVMMQFLWKYVDELVGKGLSIGLVSELFFYAALSFVPLALPLAILLASLMTFGNLGEHVELTAIKSSGISLLTVMKPLAWFVTFVAIALFFFQDYVVPKSQVKMWTLLFSMRQKSPTLDIPVGTMYSQIPGYNLYVKDKDELTNTLYGVLIYDVSNGGTTYPRIVTADSGRLSMTADKQHLLLNLYSGNWYEEMHSGDGAGTLKGELYRRETYHDKEIVVPYDATFTRMDDDAMRQQYVGKNIKELQHTIDSVNLHIDSVGSVLSEELHGARICGVPLWRPERVDTAVIFTPLPLVQSAPQHTLDSLLDNVSNPMRRSITNQALVMARSMRNECEFRGYTINDDNFVVRRHLIEMHKKFTLSLACLIFFLIGAPLGAIIRKGGLGTPIVASVILYVIYYVIDNSGYKLARDGRWPVWQGIWLSSAVLLPLGVYLTYKAVNDSAVFNPDTYVNWFKRLIGASRVRKLSLKEVIINEVDIPVATTMVQELQEQATAFISAHSTPPTFTAFFIGDEDQSQVSDLGARVDQVVDYLSNSRDKMVLGKAMDYPVLRQPSVISQIKSERARMALMIVLPVSVPLWLLGRYHHRLILSDAKRVVTVSNQMKSILTGEYSRDTEYNV